MIGPDIKGQRLVALSLLALLLLNYPIFDLFTGDHYVLGMPALYVHVFTVWALLIALMALVVEIPGD